MSSKDNPDDDGSRGLDALKVNKVAPRFNVPAFLQKPESEQITSTEFKPPNEENPGVREEKTVNAIGIKNYNILDALEERISCWAEIRNTLAYVKKLICSLTKNIKRINSPNNADQEYPCVLNVVDIQDADSSKITTLDPFIDENDVLRVGKIIQ